MRSSVDRSTVGSVSAETPTPHRPDRVIARRRSPALVLGALWIAVAGLLAGWGLLTGPGEGQHRWTGSGQAILLPSPPVERLLAVWVHWEAPRGAVGWVVLEADRPWESAEPYWRRRVHPGWTHLLWDDFSSFPPGRSVRLRALVDQGEWTVTPPRISAGYTLAHLSPLRGLLAALGAAGGAVTILVGRRLRGPWTIRRPGPWGIGLLAILGAAFGLRAYTLTTQSFWFDEVLTAIGTQSLGWVLYTPQIFGHPPLQYLVGWAMGAAQASEGWLRAPFAASGVASVAVVGYLGRRLDGPATGLVAAGLLALSAFHVELSQLARPYPLLLLGVALSLLALVRALESGAATDWVLFSAVTAVNLYTHYAASLVLLVEAGVAVTWLVRRRGRGALAAVVSFAAVGVLLAPWAPVLLRLGSAQLGGGPVSLGSLFELASSALIPQFLGPGSGGALAGVLIALGLWRFRSRPEVPVALVLWVALPLAILWALKPTHFLAGRHLAFMMPALTLAMAGGLVAVARLSGKAAQRLLGPARGWARRTGAATAILLLLLAWHAPARASLQGYYVWRQGPDWRTVAAVLDRLVPPGDSVVATLGATYPLRYYWRPTVTEVDAAALRDLSSRRGAGRLWIITLEGWDEAPELRHWLATHAIQVGEVQPSWSLARVYIHRARSARG